MKRRCDLQKISSDGMRPSLCRVRLSAADILVLHQYNTCDSVHDVHMLIQYCMWSSHALVTTVYFANHLSKAPAKPIEHLMTPHLLLYIPYSTFNAKNVFIGSSNISRGSSPLEVQGDEILKLSYSTTCIGLY